MRPLVGVMNIWECQPAPTTCLARMMVRSTAALEVSEKCLCHDKAMLDSILFRPILRETKDESRRHDRLGAYRADRTDARPSRADIGCPLAKRQAEEGAKINLRAE